MAETVKIIGQDKLLGKEVYPRLKNSIPFIVTGQGGIRTMLQAFMGNYQMAVDRYKREGTKQCYFEGKLRLADGNIKEGSWLVIGTEGSGPFTPVTVYDSGENKIIHIPDQAEFLKA